MSHSLFADTVGYSVPFTEVTEGAVQTVSARKEALQHKLSQLKSQQVALAQQTATEEEIEELQANHTAALKDRLAASETEVRLGNDVGRAWVGDRLGGVVVHDLAAV